MARVMLRCTDLRCERLVDPIGLDTRTPRLTWRLEAGADVTDVVQRSHQVEVEGRWDTGQVDGWRQQVTYDGPALASRTPLRWRVRVWTSAGDTEWSDWATFETGLFEPGDWSAAMITAAVATPVVRFTRIVDVPDDVVRARLRVTSHGIHTVTIDGTEVGDEVLAPGWTSYHHRLTVRTYDVSPLVRPGPVEVAVLVAPGWFSGRLGWDGQRDLYGPHRAALAQLELERSDGSVTTISTDEHWAASATPFLAADLYDGETYDARRAPTGDPHPVSLVDAFDPAVLIAPAVPPVRRTEIVRPVSHDGRVIDFGQNLVGWLRITVRARPPAPRSCCATRRCSTATASCTALRCAPPKATDRYIAGGADEEVYEPRFTFHGFRYVDITGVDPSQVDAVTVVVHSDLDARSGPSRCSDPLIKRCRERRVGPARQLRVGADRLPAARRAARLDR